MSVSGCRCKTVKLMDDPDLPQLVEELTGVSAWVEAMVNYNEDFDVNVEDDADSLVGVYSKFARDFGCGKMSGHSG